MLSEVNIHDYVNDIVPDNYQDFSSDEFRDRDYHAAEIEADNELSNLIYNIKNTFADWIANLDIFIWNAKILYLSLLIIPTR